MARTKKRLKIIITGHRDSLSYLIVSWPRCLTWLGPLIPIPTPLRTCMHPQPFCYVAASFGPSWTFTFYTIICVVAVIFIYKYVPETKTRTLEQISEEFNTRYSCNDPFLFLTSIQFNSFVLPLTKNTT